MSDTPKWTPAQQAAIDHIEGDLLVSAAAGSGKTAVLAERIARLVTGNPRSNLDRLLVVTFTEAAATEMRTRIAAKLRDRAATDPELLRQAAMIERANISTLHGFCTRTLRAYFHEAGGADGALDPSFEIIDADEARLLQDEILDDLLRRHHQADATASRASPGQITPFAALLESHAQGADGTLKSFILDLHRMLVTLRNPAEWLTAARLQYSPEGIDIVLAEYARQTALTLRTHVEHATDLRTRIAPEPDAATLVTIMDGFITTLTTAAAELESQGIEGWPAAQTLLHSFAFPPRITGPKGVLQFPEWRDQTVNKIKKTLASFLAGEFAQSHTPANFRARLLSLAPAAATLLDLAAEFSAAFTAAKRAQNRLDFADLERLTLDLLTRPDSTAAQDLRTRFDHVLVDEFQDINPLQAALLEAVRSPTAYGNKGNLFVVGDVKQSIYGFRLADPQEFLTLETKLRAITTHRAFLPLQNNFRTAPHLLANLNALFEKLLTKDVAGITYDADHQLHPPPAATPLPNPPPIELYLVVEDDDTEETPDDAGETDDAGPSAPDAGTLQLSAIEREARFVARKIDELLAAATPITLKDGTTRPLQPRDIAILLRSIKSRALLFTRALSERNIPVHADLSTGYFDAQEIRETLALLSVLDNPYQDIPLATLLLSVIGRFSHDDLAQIRLAYPRRADVPFHQAIHQFMLNSPADHPLANRLRAFFDILHRYRQRIRVLPLHDALAEIYDDTGLLTYVAGLPAGQQRIANLHSLHHRAKQFAGFRKQGLYRFLRFIDRLKEAEADFGEAATLSEASNVVRIMSIHKSKGLEFPVVFVSTLGSKFNLNTTAPVIIDRDTRLALAATDDARNIFIPTPLTYMALSRGNRQSRAEELRLLYVALTRARERLILTGAAKPNTWDNVRAAWSHHAGPIPRYHLLRANSFLDYLLPAAALPGMSRAIDVLVTPEKAPLAIQTAQQDESAARLATLIETQQKNPATNPAVTQLIARLSYSYPFLPLSNMPALFTVSELKKYAITDPDADQPADLTPPRIITFQQSLTEGPSQNTGITRGIATHRLLEHLPFATIHSPADLDSFIAHMLTTHLLSPDEAAAIDRPSILWFLQSPTGIRLHQAAVSAQDPSAPRLLREIPFIYALTPDELPDVAALAGIDPIQLNRRDTPHLRGVIDLLLAGDKTAEILDYKTDSAFTLPSSLPMYRRQMQYYARAVAACLNLKITHATLVLLSTRTLEPVQ